MSLEGKYNLGLDDSTILPIDCPICKKRLTAIVVNDKCIINFRIECLTCHSFATGDNIWAEKSDKEPPSET